MKSKPKTIQIFLPAGDPRSVRIAEITTRIVQVIEVPRSLLADFLKMAESNQVAVYFLFGQEEDGQVQRIYIGQTSDLRKRLAKHNKEKDFWQRALVLISKTNSLTQTHSRFLEWLCIQKAKAAGRYVTENGNDGSKPHTPAPIEADCQEIFETGRTLLATLGYPAFDPVAKPLNSSARRQFFYCSRAGTTGVGEYTEEGFVVLKGTMGRAKPPKNLTDPAIAKRRDELIAQGKAVINKDTLLFKEDVLFSTPSGASAIVVGAASNGWRDWKTDKGVTLDELKRGNSPNSAGK